MARVAGAAPTGQILPSEFAAGLLDQLGVFDQMMPEELQRFGAAVGFHREGAAKRTPRRTRAGPADVDRTGGHPAVVEVPSTHNPPQAVGVRRPWKVQAMESAEVSHHHPANRNDSAPSYDEPALLAVRFGRGAFKDAFTFTPEGSRHHPA
jgi:hypothetical protein